MKSLDIEIAVMRYFGVRRNLIVPNVSWGISGLHECDLLVLSPHGYATEIEIKISKSDLLADKKKKHGHRHNHIARLFFAVPEILKDFALEHIPERAGLFTVSEDTKDWQFNEGFIVRDAKRNKGCHEWTPQERSDLGRLGAIRIIGLKVKIQQLAKEKENAK